MNCEWSLPWMDELKLCKSCLVISITITTVVEVITPVDLLFSLSIDTSPTSDPTPIVARMISFGFAMETRPSSVGGIEDFVILTWPAKTMITEPPLLPSEKIVEPVVLTNENY